MQNADKNAAVPGGDPASSLAEEMLRESLETLRTIMDIAQDAIIMADDAGNITFWNPAAVKMFGYAPSEALGKELHKLLAPEKYQERFVAGIREFRETGMGPAIGKIVELEAVRKDGAVFPIELSLSAIMVKGGWHAVGIVRDITERRQEGARLEELVRERTEALEKSEKFLNTIFESIRDPFSIMDRDFRIVKVNEAYAEIKNLPAGSLVGRKCYEVLRGRTETCEDCVVMKTFMSKDPCAKDKRVFTPLGLEMWVDIYTYPIFDDSGEVSHVIEYTRDITERKMLEEQKKTLIKELTFLSRTDSLTGILNRRAQLEKLRNEFERVKRYGSALSLVLCDVDYLKWINDTFGHAAGDGAIKFVAETLAGITRRTDAVGRYGGDEFMLILPHTPVNEALELAERVRGSVEAASIEVEDKTLKLTVSLGVSGFEPSVKDIESLIRCADTALYASKQAGRNRVHAYP